MIDLIVKLLLLETKFMISSCDNLMTSSNF